MAKIRDERLLSTFRAAGRCELCGRDCAKRQAVHVLPKGIGGGLRMDIPENLLGACLPFAGCGHHEQHHLNRPSYPTSKLIAAVAKRLNRTPEDIETYLRKKQQETKGLWLRPLAIKKRRPQTPANKEKLRKSLLFKARLLTERAERMK